MVRDDLEARGLRVFSVSAASGAGMPALVFAMAEIVGQARAERPVVETKRIVIRPPGSTAAASSTITETPRAGACAARSPSAGCVRPTSATTRPSASSPTASTGSASRTRLVKLGAHEGDTVLIGPADNAVVFDFKPSVEAGAEMLGRRGEDERLREERPAATRRRDIEEKMPERSESETRADVARRIDRFQGRHTQDGHQLGHRPDVLRDRLQGRPRLGRRRVTVAGRWIAAPSSATPVASSSRSARRR